MGRSIHGLNVDFLLRTSYEMAGPHAVQAPDSEDLTSVPGKAWLHDDIAFRKEAAASGLADWSRMNLDLYNFNSRLVPQSDPQARLLHSLTQAACHPTSADHGMMAPIAGPLVNAGTATAVRNAKGTTLVSTTPFMPPNRMSSTLEQLPISVQTPAVLRRSLDRLGSLSLRIM